MNNNKEEVLQERPKLPVEILDSFNAAGEPVKIEITMLEEIDPTKLPPNIGELKTAQVTLRLQKAWGNLSRPCCPPGQGKCGVNRKIPCYIDDETLLGERQKFLGAGGFGEVYSYEITPAYLKDHNLENNPLALSPGIYAVKNYHIFTATEPQKKAGKPDKLPEPVEEIIHRSDLMDFVGSRSLDFPETSVCRMMMSPFVVRAVMDMAPKPTSTLYDYLNTKMQAAPNTISKYNVQYILDPRIRMNYAFQLVIGIAHFHCIGMAHGDLKSPNILLFDQQTTLQLADFGFSSSKWIPVMNDMSWCATSGWRSPEIILAEQNTPPSREDVQRLDVWVMGLILAFLFGCPIDIQQNEVKDAQEAVGASDAQVKKDPEYFERISYLAKMFLYLGIPTLKEWPQQDRNMLSPGNSTEQKDIWDAAVSVCEKYKKIVPQDKQSLRNRLLNTATPPLMIDLIENMMRMNPKKRFTALEVLGHSVWTKKFKSISSGFVVALKEIVLFNKRPSLLMKHWTLENLILETQIDSEIMDSTIRKEMISKISNITLSEISIYYREIQAELKLQSISAYRASFVRIFPAGINTIVLDFQSYLISRYVWQWFKNNLNQKDDLLQIWKDEKQTERVIVGTWFIANSAYNDAYAQLQVDKIIPNMLRPYLGRKIAAAYITDVFKLLDLDIHHPSPAFLAMRYLFDENPLLDQTDYAYRDTICRVLFLYSTAASLSILAVGMYSCPEISLWCIQKVKDMIFAKIAPPEHLSLLSQDHALHSYFLGVTGEEALFQNDYNASNLEPKKLQMFSKLDELTKDILTKFLIGFASEIMFDETRYV